MVMVAQSAQVVHGLSSQVHAASRLELQCCPSNAGHYMPCIVQPAAPASVSHAQLPTPARGTPPDSSLPACAPPAGNVLVEATAKIGVGCVIGPDVSIGAGCVIGDGVRLSNCVIMTGVSIKEHSKVDNCIIGWESRIGAWARVENNCVIGKDVEVKVGGWWWWW